VSDDVRAVPLDAEQFSLIEELGLEKMRAGEHETATRLLAIALAWKVSPPTTPPRVFRCNVDESAGLAEVVHLDPWSRKAPCA
jgi:hypothetical protein